MSRPDHTKMDFLKRYNMSLVRRDDPMWLMRVSAVGEPRKPPPPPPRPVWFPDPSTWRGKVFQYMLRRAPHAATRAAITWHSLKYHYGMWRAIAKAERTLRRCVELAGVTGQDILSEPHVKQLHATIRESRAHRKEQWRVLKVVWSNAFSVRFLAQQELRRSN